MPSRTVRRGPAGPGPIAIGRQHYLTAPVPVHFPSEERLQEAVPETKQHLEGRTTLYLLLKDAFAAHAIGSAQFVYYDASEPRKRLSPDIFVKKGSHDRLFDNWKIWLSGAPDLAVEIVSKMDRRDDDWSEMLARYRASGIGEVVRFDASDAAHLIRIWDRVEGDMIERASSGPHFHECTTLGLWWLVEQSEYGTRLRLARDREGRDRLLTPQEDCARLAAELASERKARALAMEATARAKEATQQTKRATQRAEQARDAALAEIARLQAELAQARGQKP
jgi:hypothetical protein